MKSLPSRRFSRFGVSRSAGRSGSTAAAQSEGGADTTVSASQSEVTSSPANILNNGTATSTVTVTLRNASGTPLSGKTVTLSSTGSNNTIVQPGTTNGSGVATGTIASTTAEAKTVTAVSEGITVTDTATVTALSAITPLFASDWRTATGTSTAATSDTSGVASDTGPGFTIDGGANDVVANSGLGFTVGSTNVLRVPGDTGGILRKTGMGTQAVGDTRYYFIEARWDLPNGTVDTQTHPFQDGDAGGFVHELMLYNNAGDDVVAFRIGFQPTQTPVGDYQWRCPFDLAKGTVYRFGWAVTYTSSTQFTFEIRVWNTSGTLLASDDGVGATHGAFYNESSSETLADANAGGGFNVGTRSISESGGYNVGTNDVYAEFAPTYGYQSTFAIADNQGWITAPSDVLGFT